MKPSELTVYTGAIQCRLATIPSASLANYPDPMLNSTIDRYRETQQVERIDPKTYGHLLDVRSKNPAHGVASGKQIAGLLAEDFEHFRNVKAAAANGDVVSIPAGNAGEREYGIVDMKDRQEPKRTGLWTTVNKDGVRIAQGTYVDDQKHGVHREFQPDGRNVKASSYWENGVQQKNAYIYNEKSEPILKESFKDGEKIATDVIDPAQQKEQREKRRVEQAAIHAVKF
jgi:hypothetical protein